MKTTPERASTSPAFASRTARCSSLGFAVVLATMAGCSKETTTNGPPAASAAAEHGNSGRHAEHAGAAKAGPNTATNLPGVVAPAGGKKTYGAPIDAQTPSVTLTEVLATPSKYADKTVRLSGKITAVCQGMGCWLQLGDEKGTAHVKLRGHSFFVPKTSAGQSAMVEARVMPQPDEGHCEEEAKEQTGVVAKVELEASGVEIF